MGRPGRRNDESTKATVGFCTRITELGGKKVYKDFESSEDALLTISASYRKKDISWFPRF